MSVMKATSPPETTNSPGVPEWALRGRGRFGLLAVYSGFNSSRQLKNGGLHMLKSYEVSVSTIPSSIFPSWTVFTETEVQNKPSVTLNLSNIIKEYNILY